MSSISQAIPQPPIAPQRQSLEYAARLIATSIFVPAVAMILTVTLFVANRDIGVNAPWFGVLGAVVIWLIVSALPLRSVADPKYGIPTSYADLCQHLDEVDALIATLSRQIPEDILEKNPAYIEATIQREQVKQDLETRGVRWAIGYGYTAAWSRVHRAEEALIAIAPLDYVIEGAYYDELRLEGSEMPNRDHLLMTLRKAVETLGPDATRYLKTPVQSPASPGLTIQSIFLPDGAVGASYDETLQASGGTVPYEWRATSLPKGMTLSTDGTLSGTPADAATSAITVTVKDANGSSATRTLKLTIHPQPWTRPVSTFVADAMERARLALRKVRRAINEYRDERWNGLIVERNRLLVTCAFTAMAFFAILAVAIAAEATKKEIMAATACWLVGAAVGLGKRLRDETQASSAVIDEGLSAARMITTPFFSGVCAVCGVVLTAMLPFIDTTKTGTVAQSLQNVFNIAANPMSLFIAAMFGFAPGLLFDRLQQQADRFKTELKNSKATGPTART